MITVNDLLSGIRNYLRFPPEMVLGDGTILDRLLDKLDFYTSELNLTDQNWLLEKFPLPVSANEGTYTITPGDWGRPILCETVDDTDPQYIRREVPIVDFQDRDRFYSGPNTALQRPVQCISFYQKGGAIRVDLTPIPSTSGAYQIWYEPSRIIPTALTSTPLRLECFANLVKVDTALSCLPDCNYDDTRYSRIKEALDRDFSLYMNQFQIYKTQDRQEQLSDGRCWGADYPFEGVF